MNILVLLRQEEARLNDQLRGIQSAITALNGSHSTQYGRRRRTMSAAARAKISKAAKARWAKIRAAKSK